MKEPKKRKINVIVPMYKGNSYIYSLIHMMEDNWKVVNKTDVMEIELILVNDYPEEELIIRHQWIKNISSKVITNKKNKGIHFARMQGLLHSDGEYLLFLDQDDEISPVYMREQLKAINGNDAVICNGKNKGELIYRNSEEWNKVISIDEYKNGYNRIVSPGQVLLRREAVPEEWLKHIMSKNGADDYFLWLLMFLKNCKFGIQKKALYWHKISGENVSKNISHMNDSVFEMVEIMVNLGYLTRQEGLKIKDARSILVERKLSWEGYEKERNYKQILEVWMRLRDKKISIESFLNKMGIKTLVIYGAGNLGKHLYYELDGKAIQVRCFLDRNEKAGIVGVETVVTGGFIGEVDAIIVSPFMEYAEIKKELEKYYFCNIFSIETVLFNANCELVTE